MSQPQNQKHAEMPDYGAPPIQPSPEPEPAKLGPWQRLIGTLFSPGETFQDVNRKPTWLVPVLVITAITAAYIIFMNSQTDEGWHQMIREQSRGQSGGAGGAAKPEDLELGVTIGKWGTVGAFVVGIPIYCVIVAGVFALALMVMQAQTTFKKILSVVAWSSCATGIVQTIVTSASLLARDAESVSRLQPKDWGTISATNLAVVLPSGTSPALVALASSFDIFMIWFLILLVIGFTAVSGARRITRGKVAAVVFGFYIVVILIKVGAASVFGR